METYLRCPFSNSDKINIINLHKEDKKKNKICFRVLDILIKEENFEVLNFFNDFIDRDKTYTFELKNCSDEMYTWLFERKLIHFNNSYMIYFFYSKNINYSRYRNMVENFIDYDTSKNFYELINDGILSRLEINKDNEVIRKIIVDIYNNTNIESVKEKLSKMISIF